MSKKRNSKKRAHHDLEPPSGRDGLERREAASRNIGELQVLRHGEVAREADTRFNRNDLAADFRIRTSKYKCKIPENFVLNKLSKKIQIQIC